MVTFTFGNTYNNTVAPQNSAWQELSGHQPRGNPGVRGIGAIIVGAIVAGAGVFMWMLVTGQVPVHVTTTGAVPPAWTLSSVSAVFVIIGGSMVLGGTRDLQKRRAIDALRNASPGEPWLWDYSWNEYGTDDGGWADVRRAIFFAVFMSLFLVPFHLVFMKAEVPFFAKAVIGIFDIFAIAILGNAVYLTLRHLKYGRTGLRFKHFPYALGDEITVALAKTPRLAPLKTITGTLRCIQERVETRGSGRDRTTVDVCYAMWSNEQTVDISTLRESADEIPFTFKLPDTDGMTTALSQQPPRYWELEVKAETTGVDYGARFLVPVYGKKGKTG